MNGSTGFGALGVLSLTVGLLAGCSLLGGGSNEPKSFCQDSDARGYARMALGHVKATREATERLRELMPRLQREQALIVTSGWREAVSDQLSAIIHASQQVQLMRTPRSELRGPHETLLRAYAVYERGANGIHDGLRREHAPTALVGFRVLQTGTDLFEAAREELTGLLRPCAWYP